MNAWLTCVGGGSGGTRAARLTAALAVGAAAVLLTGCGSTSATSGSSGSVAGSGVATSGGQMGTGTQLTVVVDDGHGGTQTWTLQCDPPGGTHPDPAAACAALERSGAAALPPVSPDMGCTQVYGGPETARVTGTWRGQAVDASFSRTDGCEISRWDRLKGLLPAGGM